MHVRNQDMVIEGEFTDDSMRLELLIDLDDLLRDRGVLGIGEWDANGAYCTYYSFKRLTGEMSTSHFVPIAMGHDGKIFTGPG
jgi:hypothetical protein